ncbi:MAG: cache domain-containing protein [Pseudomonadota bacterium]
MKIFLKILILNFFIFLFFNVSAADRGTKEEAVVLVNRAAEYIRKNGKDKAITEFNNQNGQFIDRDMYIFSMDKNMIILSHNNKKIIGRDFSKFKDGEGKMMSSEMKEILGEKGSGWIYYKWPDPVSNGLLDKASYLVRVNDIIIGCGIYR